MKNMDLESIKQANRKLWEPLFNGCNDELNYVYNILDREEKNNNVILPYRNEIYAAFELVNPFDIKVVIVGQDPSPACIEGTNIPNSHGLSYSVRREAKMPLAVKNIKKEIERTIPDTELTSGCLESWALQGIFMLNTSFTVNRDKAKSHGIIWYPFIKKVLLALCEVNKNIMFCLWGNEAKRINEFIPSCRKKFLAGHPCVTNWNDTSEEPDENKFPFCNHFALINEELVDMGKEPINWST